jgi:hypothetical protein
LYFLEFILEFYNIVLLVVDVLALVLSNSNSLSFFVSQILEFDNSPNVMAKKKNQSSIVCHNSLGKIKSWAHVLVVFAAGSSVSVRDPSPVVGPKRRRRLVSFDAHPPGRSSPLLRRPSPSLVT